MLLFSDFVAQGALRFLQRPWGFSSTSTIAHSASLHNLGPRTFFTVSLRVFHIPRRVSVYALEFLRCQRAPQFPRMPHKEAARCDLGSLRQKRTRGNDRARAHTHVVQQNRAHAHQHPRFDRAAVQNHTVTDCHILFENERILILHHVQDRPVLNIAPRADTNPVHVAANHRARPYTGVLADRHVANNHGCWIDVCRRCDLRQSAAIAADHSLTLVLRPIPTRAIALLIPEAPLQHKHATLAHAEFTDKKLPTQPTQRRSCHSEGAQRPKNLS